MLNNVKRRARQPVTDDQEAYKIQQVLTVDGYSMG